MLRKLSAALVGLALSAGAATAEETTIKFTLGWKTQGSDAAFFYAKDNGFFKEEGPQRHHRPGRGLRRHRHARDVRRL
ncbi:ABC-type nitrate/sulfonate/bicarbonate transport system substrate-binding protein [Bradyrhizobium liaoningense]